MLKNTLHFGFISEVQKENTAKKETTNQFDSSAGDAAQQVMSLDDQAFNNELMALRRSALFAVLQLTNDIIEDDLEDDELPSDRLDAYLTAETKTADGEEVSELEAQVVQIKAAFMSDAMSSLGVDDDTITKAFDTDVNEADDAISKIAETIEVNLPTGDDLDDFITEFLYGDDGLDMEAGQVDEYDSAQLGKNKVRKTKSGQTLVYKGVKAVRHGKITVVNKRVGNTFMKVKLSPKQKAALRKAAAKAVSPNAIKKRIKSLKIGFHNGIYKQNKGL
jgi:hypothetical protein